MEIDYFSVFYPAYFEETNIFFWLLEKSFEGKS